MAKNKKIPINVMNNKKRDEEVITYESLESSFKELIQLCIEQQQILVELVKIYKDDIDKNPRAAKLVKGISESIKDIANETTNAASVIKDDNGNYKKGIVDPNNHTETIAVIDLARTLDTSGRKILEIATKGFAILTTELEPNEDFKKEMDKKVKESLEDDKKENDKNVSVTIEADTRKLEE